MVSGIALSASSFPKNVLVSLSSTIGRAGTKLYMFTLQNNLI